MRKLLVGLLLVVVSSCYVGVSVNEQRRRERLRESEKMFRETQRVRKACTPRKSRASGERRRGGGFRKRVVYYK